MHLCESRYSWRNNFVAPELALFAQTTFVSANPCDFGAQVLCLDRQGGKWVRGSFIKRLSWAWERGSTGWGAWLAAWGHINQRLAAFYSWNDPVQVKDGPALGSVCHCCFSLPPSHDVAWVKSPAMVQCGTAKAPTPWAGTNGSVGQIRPVDLRLPTPSILHWPLCSTWGRTYKTILFSWLEPPVISGSVC